MSMSSPSSAVTTQPVAEPSPAPMPVLSPVPAMGRALVACLHPRVIWWSLQPLVLALVVLGGVAWWRGAALQAWADQLLRSWGPSAWLLDALTQWVGAWAADAVATGLVLAISIPLVVVVCLLFVAVTVAPAASRWVASRLQPPVQSRSQASIWASMSWSLGATALALAALVVSLPLWFIPPLGMVIPPLIWGWLTYRVMAFDALAEHATVHERQHLLRTHRLPLLLMGVASAFLGAAPAALWALGVVSVLLAPLMVVVSVWLYVFLFVFSCLWFAHYLLEALGRLRAGAAPVVSTL